MLLKVASWKIVVIVMLLLVSQALLALGSRRPKTPPPGETLPPDSFCHQLASFAQNPVGQIIEDQPVDQIVVDKGRRLLYLLQGDQAIRSYKIAMGASPQGHKRQQGDERTPEGNYLIEYKNPNSKYHLSLAVDYPNAADEAYAEEHGVSPGGDIMIHGLPNPWWQRMFVNHPEKNWTNGCIAVNDQEIEEIWELVEAGTRIEICR
ncbi:MAG: L,D-transpeptidase family protein [Bdellovibrionales bacterium]|jgi:murein L,D-transpeptidase YafK|nr:L,D-transpeptidase family protein [Bdellovibrionales bacterium]MBT3526597.1 L,D-transpeptidase family protein [Bdellovibrionales bacterium]